MREVAAMWPKRKFQAAELLARGELTHPKVAEQVGCHIATLNRWKEEDAFLEKVWELTKLYEKKLVESGIANRLKRIDGYQKRWEGLWQIKNERAADPAMQDIPGGKTGLLVHRVKGIGKGDTFQVIDEYEVDGVLLREFRELEQQTAIELGQWTRKSEAEIVQTSSEQVTHRHTIDLESMPLELKKQLLQYVRGAGAGDGESPKPVDVIEQAPDVPSPRSGKDTNHDDSLNSPNDSDCSNGHIGDIAPDSSNLD